MAVTSANPHNLKQFVDDGVAKRAGCQDLLNGAASTSYAVVAQSSEFHPQSDALGKCRTLLEAMRVNEHFVDGVHDAVVAADRVIGAPSADDRLIAKILSMRGLAARPGVIPTECTAIYGIAPTSGFAADPICAANGNFVHGDLDLMFPGFSACLNLSRIYNSLAHARLGAFGRGWSSSLDMSLDTDEHGLVSVSLADGAVVGFPQDEKHGYLPDDRRRLTLEREGEGWKLTRDFTESWSFDADGLITVITSGAAVAKVDRAEGQVRVTEQLSGRSVIYLLELGLVVEALASDGRRCQYHYDGGAHLLVVDRPAGSLRYALENGMLVSITDADGVTVCENLYDADGRVLEQATAHGRTTIFRYDDLGTTRISDNESGPVNVMVHDRRGNVTSLIDGLGNDMRMEYDSAGQVTRRFDRLGAETSYTYGDDARVATRLDPDGGSQEWTWDALGRLLTQIDRSGGLTCYEYAADGRTPVAVTAPDGAKTRTATNEQDMPTERSDADGVVTHFDWDRDGQIAGVVDSLGNRTDFRYDERGQLVEVTNASDVFARFAIDAAGRVTSATTFDGTRRLTYSDAGRVQSCTETDGGTWRAGYDSAGEVNELTDAEGGVLRLGRDTHGNITTFTAPDGLVFEHEYDEVGRLSRAIDPAGNATLLEYDAEGRTTSIIDARSGLKWARTVDFAGRTLSMTSPDGSVSSRAYHPNGQLASTTDAAGHTWTHSIDPAGRLVESLDPLGGTRTYTYSPAGRPVGERSPAGRVVERAFDPAGRLASVLEDGMTTSYAHRPDGQVHTVTQGPATIALDYDDFGRLSSAQGPNVSFSQVWEHGRVVEQVEGGARSTFGWDLRGLPAQVIDPAGVGTDFVHDVKGQQVAKITDDQRVTASFGITGSIERFVDALGNATDLTTDARGLLREVHFPDGRGLCLEYNVLGLSEVVRTTAGVEVARFSHDAVGRVLSATSNDHVTRVEHDGIGLTKTVTAPDYRLRYERDPDGAVESLDQDGFLVQYQRDEDGNLSGFELDDSTRIGLPGEREVVRDEVGRIQRDEFDRHFSYDEAGRLAECIGADGRSTVYSYGQTGLLIAEREESLTQQYVYNRGGQLVQRIRPEGAVDYSYDAVGRQTSALSVDGSCVRYEWDELDRLVGVERRDRHGSCATSSITYDGFNNPVLIDKAPIVWDLGNSGKAIRVGDTRYLRYGSQVRSLDETGSWTYGLNADPWGCDGAEGLRLGFRGEVALGPLVFMGARVYDSEARCFLSRDPAPPEPGALAFAGPYNYAWNDPINYVDPSGLKPLSDQDYDAIQKRSDDGRFVNAWNNMAADPWGTLAMVGVVAIGVALCFTPLAPFGVGILVSATLAAGVGLALDDFKPRQVAVSGALGFILPGGGGVVAHIALGAAVSGGANVIEQVVTPGKGIHKIDWGEALLSAGVGGFAQGGGKAVTSKLLPWLKKAKAPNFKTGDVSTERGTAYFWTGRTRIGPVKRTDWVDAAMGPDGRFRAQEFAAAKGRTTLEGLIESRGIKMPAWSKNARVQAKWAELSRRYAAGVSGDVYVVMGREVRPDAIWHIEFKELQKNANVTRVIKIDLTTGRESVIFSRAEMLARTQAKITVRAAKRAEPQLTTLVTDLAAKHGGTMSGMEYRLKTVGSLTGKIERGVAAEKSTPAEIAAKMFDVNRYTTLYPEANYAIKAQATIDELRKHGHEVKVKNYWNDAKNPYQGVNVQVTTRPPGGRQFELQFHTPDSIAAKEGELHRIYELQRKLPATKINEAKIEEYNQQMHAISEKIPVPQGIGSVK